MPRPESFTHLYVDDGSITMALRVSGDKLEVGVSFCAPDDKPNKSKGNKIALGRLNQKRGFYLCTKNDLSLDPKLQAEMQFNALLNLEDPYTNSAKFGWVIRRTDYTNDYLPRWLASTDDHIHLGDCCL